MKFGCWVISLNEQDDQTQKLLSSLSEQGVNATVFPAVDGRNSMPPLCGEEFIDEKEAILRHKQLLTNSQVGCYLSHYRAIERAFLDGFDRVCLLEDDVVIESDFAKCLNQLLTLPDDFEMIRLMALKIRKRKVLRPLFDDSGSVPHQLVRLERGGCGTQGYLLSRVGMKKVLEHGKRIFEPIDKFYDHFFEYDLKLYGVEPHLIYEKSAVSTVSQKPSNRPKLTFFQKIKFHIFKGYRSFLRHSYLRRYSNEFYPAEFPSSKPGNTERMK